MSTILNFLSLFSNPFLIMHSSYALFALLTSILFLTTAVRPHPQVPLPSSGEPLAAFPLENSGIMLRKHSEDVGFGTPRFLKAFPLDGSPSGVEQFLSSTSGGNDNGNGVELRINHPGIVPSDQISNRSGEGNLISQSNACDQRSDGFKSRRLRNRNPPSSCLANPIERNTSSEPQTEPDKVQSGAGDRELNEEKSIPVDVPDFDFPIKGKDYMGTSTKATENPEICPPERPYPVCADDQAIIAMPEELAHLFTQVTYMLNPAYACTSPRWIPCSYHRRNEK